MKRASFVLGSVATLSYPKSAGAQTLPKIVVTWGAEDVVYAPIWITYESGLFHQNGLDVDLQYQPATLQIPSIVSGQVQIGHVGWFAVASANVAGADLVAIGNICPVLPYLLMVPNAIRSAGDLRGKTLGISKFGDATDVATRLALEHAGVDPKDVTIVQVGSSENRTAALLSGAIQGGVISPPITTQIQAQGFHAVVDLAKLNLRSALTVIARRSWVSAHRDLTQHYIDALMLGMQRERHDRPFATGVIKTYLKMSDQRLVDATYDYYANEVLPKLPVTSPDELKIGVSEADNDKLKSYDPTTMVDNSFVENAAKRLKLG